MVSITILKALGIAIISFVLVTEAVPTLVNSTAVSDITPDCVDSWGFATFYDDNACSVGGGIAVSMGNSGCLANEIGRNSVFIRKIILF